MLIYPEGGMPGLLLKQKQAVKTTDTFRVQLVPIRSAPKAKIGGPEDVVRLVKEMEDYDREYAKLIHLDTKNQVMGIETISIGSLSASIVHPRETVKGAILNNSANVIFVHNHPSGICEPSNEDVMITGRLKEAFETVGIALLDSIIVGKGCRFSMRESGFVSGKTVFQETTFQESNYVAEGIRLVPREKLPELKKRIQEQVNFIQGLLPRQRTPEHEAFLRSAPRLIEVIDRELASGKGKPSFVSEAVTKGSAEKVQVTPSQETPDKVQFITAMTEYITAPDVERKKRAAEKIQASRYYKIWFDKFFYEHDTGSAKQNLMKFFGANEQGLGLVNYAYYSVLSEYLRAISKPVAELTVREGTIHGMPIKKKLSFPARKIPESIPALTGAALQRHTAKVMRTPQIIPFSEVVAEKQAKLGTDGAEVEIKYEPGKIFPYRVVYAGTDKTVQTREYPEAMAYYTELEAERGIAEEGLTLVKKGRSPSTVSENIQTINNIEVFLNRLTVDTSRYSRAVPIPESQVIGAAIPADGFLFAYHVTDNPEETMRKLKSNIPLCQMNPEGDLGCGFYVSSVPEYWRGRSTRKWEFARNLNRAQRQKLVDVILSDPNYKKGGGYLADFEVDYLNRDLKQFVETGDVNVLAMTGNQPYNVHITKEIARKAGVPVPEEPGFIKVKMQGKFINAVGLYSNAEMVNRAQAWAVINRPKMLQYDKRASTQNIINAWLCSMGYAGAFTKSGFSTNPEMVVWDRRAILGAWIPEPQT